MTHRNNFATYLSPAKLNLGLKITGKRPDGYHLLKTVFCLIDLFDEIDIQVTDNGKISLIDHRQAWPYHHDLIYRAAILLHEFGKPKFGVNINVQKTIPSGAGLGGGSSNAATLLIVLNRLWNINATHDELMLLGARLGADVPFFIYGKNAVATGIGDIFTPIDIEEQYFVLVQPSFHIPTKNIFSHLNFNMNQINHEEISTEKLISTHENDLFATAIKLYPQLLEIRDELQEYGKPAMTGSGSTMYLSFLEKNIAKKVAKKLENRYNTYLVKRLEHSPLQHS